jgi:CRISPR system Cascade subunit CasA
MPNSSDSVPTFNLWTERWIMLERLDGSLERLGIEQTLLRVSEFRNIYEPSPLVVVGIHRLLVAILQSALNLQKDADLKRLWAASQFPAKAVRDFGKRYAGRFDLFSEDAPFLQSADLSLQPAKDDDTKSVSYLTVDTSRSTTIEHYRHGRSNDEFFCSACAAAGLVIIPAFTSSGGRGLKPSINGVPPIYVLPGGNSLFESLAASLVTPEYQPEVASKKSDDAWWVRRPVVKKSHEVREVGYLHSLTFPARRVRLHPELLDTACTRCGRASEWGVRTMIFEMGESRSKEAAFWFDPFAAYRMREDKPPTPIRPDVGRALWREFAGLFLQSPAADGSKIKTKRPSVLDQIANLELDFDQPTYPFRCVGLRTDMKAKVFEWIDAGFDVPPALLRDAGAGLRVNRAIQFAAECDRIIAGVFRAKFGKSQKAERYKRLRVQMGDDYWAALAAPFQSFILALASQPAERQEAELHQWADTVTRQALDAFKHAADTVGDNAANLRQRVEGERLCSIKLNGYKKKQYPPREEELND